MNSSGILLVDLHEKEAMQARQEAMSALEEAKIQEAALQTEDPATAKSFDQKWIKREDGLIDVTASVASFTRNDCHKAIAHFEKLLKIQFKSKPGKHRSEGLANSSRTLVLLYHKIATQFK